MQTYLNTLRRIYEEGDDREGRNGATRALFALQMRFPLGDKDSTHHIHGFPAVTTKKLAFKMMKGELLWFLEGSEDENRLRELMGRDDWSIWTDNAYADYWTPKAEYPGHVGRIYGVQWRRWRAPDGREIDQLAEVIEKIKHRPTDRRLVVSAWNPGEIDQMALPPCHMMFQFFVSGDKLSLHMIQRSCDMFLGVPFNIASYALLLCMVAHVTGYTPHEVILTLNDAHIYHDHFAAVEEQLQRTPLDPPQLWLNPEITDIDHFSMNDIQLVNYEHHPPIKAKMAV